MLDFLNLRAQASESSVTQAGRKRHQGDTPGKRGPSPRSMHSYLASVNDPCVVCKTGKHPLYASQTFKNLPHDQKIALVKSNNLCLNCLRPGHMIRRCPSSQRCRKCQRPHHSLLHIEGNPGDDDSPVTLKPVLPKPPIASNAVQTNPDPVTLKPVLLKPPIVSNVAQTDPGRRHVLLMTSRVIVVAPDGTTTRARALLDSASSASFVSEHLAQHLRLPRRREFAEIAGIGGVSHRSLFQSIVCFGVTDSSSTEQVIGVEAVVLPKVTSDLPVRPVPFDEDWRHITGLRLADPDVGRPSSVDILLGMDVFSTLVLHGRRFGPPGTPSAFETRFGWVLAGVVQEGSPQHHIVSCHVSILTGDDLLRRFWEVEECGSDNSTFSLEEQSVVEHFRDESGRFIVPLPQRADARPIGESRSTAIRRFLSLERSLRSKGQFGEFSSVIGEYFDMGHAEPVPPSDLDKPCSQVFYLPMHAVIKTSISTTKVRPVFDASVKSSSGVSLNDRLLVGPTVHASLVDVLLRFRFHRITLTTDVSRMYRGVLLPESERDLHRFVWRKDSDEVLRDYRMTRLTFGVSASSFAANMAVKQNVIDLSGEFPEAASAVLTSFYVDDRLTGADSLEDAIKLQQQLQELFARAGFLLRKWRSSAPDVLHDLSPHLLDENLCQPLPDADGFSKALGIEWSTNLDCFRLTVSQFPHAEVLTKRALISDVARTYDIFGWYAPAIVPVKILFQHLWEAKPGMGRPRPS